eukprot:7811572-Lingulodinium_polyedra.AAC.1
MTRTANPELERSSAPDPAAPAGAEGDISGNGAEAAASAPGGIGEVGASAEGAAGVEGGCTAAAEEPKQ